MLNGVVQHYKTEIPYMMHIVSVSKLDIAVLIGSNFLIIQNLDETT